MNVMNDKLAKLDDHPSAGASVALFVVLVRALVESGSYARCLPMID